MEYWILNLMEWFHQIENKHKDSEAQKNMMKSFLIVFHIFLFLFYVVYMYTHFIHIMDIRFEHMRDMCRYFLHVKLQTKGKPNWILKISSGSLLFQYIIIIFTRREPTLSNDFSFQIQCNSNVLFKCRDKHFEKTTVFILLGRYECWFWFLISLICSFILQTNTYFGRVCIHSYR